ncbi:methyltransferase domain-containing protein [Actinomadura sp. LD22]|uniref:Methyltransferase domain-containing protein n=1 Tax=Actinomadura physcomitrii TaxID=2650748 RepID=A0A6I4MNC0_9ACTN|nr:class I SAM-dependent methyltransferase [Actinomadura physcomitrii]MWA03746.1 methyltransferase domain-containing protein [Actinomadura physcomitrii]
MDTIELQRIARIGDDNWWYRERRAIVSGELLRFSVPGAAVDIGAGAGADARMLSGHGWRATAIDLNPEAVALARAQGVEAYEGDARYLPLPGGAYDLALAMDVLAHIEDDRRAAAEIVRVLRPGGTALVSVPCDMGLWSAHDVALGRVRRYARGAFAELLEGAGLLVDRLWSRGVLLRPVLRRLRHRMTRREDLAPLHPAANEALRLSMALERRLPLWSWPGTWLFARCRRPG